MTSTPSAEESIVGPTGQQAPRPTAPGEAPSELARPVRRNRGNAGEPTTAAAAPQQSRPPSGPARTATTPAVTTGETQATGAKEPRRLLGYRRQRYEARKVRRLVRHVDPWSMLKLSLMLALCMWLITMIAAVILWTVARNAGTISSVEDFVNSSMSLQDWKLDGTFIFRQFGLITLLLALGFAGATVIASLVFNLISDIIGGVWISVIEEETARPVSESKRAPRVG